MSNGENGEMVLNTEFLNERSETEDMGQQPIQPSGAKGLHLERQLYFVISVNSAISRLTQTVTKTFENYFCTHLNLNLSKFLPQRALQVQTP